MVEFGYNNSKNASTGHISFELNCSYHPCVCFENKCNTHSRSSSVKKLAMALRKLMDICRQNFLNAQDLQKRAYDKERKSWNYAPGEKIWLISKQIKIKRDQKLEANFFRLFRVLYSVRKQVYKLELQAKQRINNLFHVLLLEQNTTRKGREFSMSKFEPGENKEYKVKTIQDSSIYTKEADRHLPRL